MKFTIATAALLLLLGTTASAYARQEKGNEGHSQTGHSQAARPAQRQARPAQQQRQTRPAARQQTRTARPAQQQHVQHAASTQRPQTQAVNRSQPRNGGRSQARVQQTSTAAENRGNYARGRISDASYTSILAAGIVSTSTEATMIEGVSSMAAILSDSSIRGRSVGVTRMMSTLCTQTAAITCTTAFIPACASPSTYYDVVLSLCGQPHFSIAQQL